MTRRSFLLAVPPAVAAARELRCDVAVIGGGVGGCAAALAAVRSGMRVVMTEETDWIGGQLTSQAVPPDEHPWIESFGCTRSYRDYRNGVRDYYRRHYPLTAEARARAALNPGDGSVSRLTHEPRVSLEVLESMLAPWVSAGKLTVLLEHKAVRADSGSDRISAVTVKSASGREVPIAARYFVDATEMGDLLPLSKTEFVTGDEARKQPANHQAFTVCFAVDYVDGEDHTIDRPAEYAFWRDYVPVMRPPWPGRLLSWSMSNPQTLKERAVTFDPTAEGNPQGLLNLFVYRRIANRRNFAAGAYAGDISLINWPQNDYWLGNLYGAGDAEAARHLRAESN